MAHCINPSAEEILDREYPVLDHGFVRLIDYMGDDSRIVQAARVSYGDGTKTVREDAGLIDYLLRNEHTSPFEQVVFTFHAKMPVFVARQWIRHRTARLNEISGRYSILPDEFYVPGPADVAEQSTDNKQGRQAEPVSAEQAESVRKSISEIQNRAYTEYANLTGQGIARELARTVLPLSLYTQWYWQIDLHNLFHFLKLRLDSHAQKEIRVYAQVIRDLAATVCPLAFESFERHISGGVRFSKDELTALKKQLNGEAHGLSGRTLARYEDKLK